MLDEKKNDLGKKLAELNCRKKLHGQHLAYEMDANLKSTSTENIGMNEPEFDSM